MASVRACAYHSLREQCMLVRRTALTEIQKRGRDLEEIGGVRQRVASLLTLLNAHRDAPHVQVSDLSHSSHPSHSYILLLFPSLSFLHSLTLPIPLILTFSYSFHPSLTLTFSPFSHPSHSLTPLEMSLNKYWGVLCERGFF